MQLTRLFRKRYYPLNTIEISSSALLHNYQYLSSLDTNMRVAPVLKSNAYGHGLVLVAKILDEVGAPFFCVDSLYEAYELLKKNIKTQILITGYVYPENLKVKKLPFSFAVYDEALAAAVSRYQPHAGIHIFVDTGMHREGISLDDLPGFLAYVKSLNQGGLKIEGLISHFGRGEDSHNATTKQQVANFAKAEKIMEGYGFLPRWRHIAASGALLHHKEYNREIGNLARSGIALYGIDPEGKDVHLQPVLQLTSTLNQVKRLRKGEKVGYDFTFTAKKDITIGVLPLGYFDGVDRRLSNRGVVLAHPLEGEGEVVVCPIIGRVSMNLTTIDLSNVKDPQVGQKVIVYSSSPSNANSVFNAAQMCEGSTIPYDLFVHFSSTTKRVVA